MCPPPPKKLAGGRSPGGVKAIFRSRQRMESPQIKSQAIPKMLNQVLSLSLQLNYKHKIISIDGLVKYKTL
jgi:hypothetical protein